MSYSDQGLGDAVWHLQVSIDRDAARSLANQIRTAVISAIDCGSLAPGTRLPSTRQLSTDLAVSRSVVVEAYEQLCAEGYLRARRGAGTVVAESDSALNKPLSSPLMPDPATNTDVLDLRTGVTAVTLFPRREWLTAMSSAIRKTSKQSLDYAPPAGLRAVRNVLANYVGRVCAVRTTADGVMLTAGFAQGLSLFCKMLLQRGISRLAVENPGHPAQSEFITSLGMQPVPTPVDKEGIQVEALKHSNVQAVLVTPTYQFPTGARMSTARREELVAWARSVDGWIIEDDFDGALAYGQRPPALQSLDPDRVIYATTVSKILAPGLRLGWLVAPSTLRADLECVRATMDLGVSTIDQLALGHFIEDGRLDRHIRNVRSRLRQRREVLETGLRKHLPHATPSGVQAGLHVYVQLPPNVDEGTMVRAATSRGVLVRGSEYYCFDGRHGRRPGFVVNYVGAPVSHLTKASRLLGAAYDDCIGRHPP